MLKPLHDTSDGKLPPMNVVITGAQGQLGSLLCQGAPAHVNVVGVDAQQLDISDAQAVTAFFSLIKADVVINAAAYTQVDRAEAEPARAFAVNRDGVRNLVTATGAATRLLHVSTDFVFDGNSSTPCKPYDPTGPLGVYGHSKLAGEQVLLQDAASRSCIIRTAWLYAASGKNFVNTMLGLMQNREQLAVVNDQRGSPTSAHGLADAIWRFVALPHLTGVYHWTDSGEASWFDFACEIQAQALRYGLLQRRIPVVPIPTTAYPTPAVRPKYSVLDNTLTWQTLSCSGTPWQAALEKVMLLKQLNDNRQTEGKLP